MSDQTLEKRGVCVCGHDVDDHSLEGIEDDGSEYWWCFGGGPCPCPGPPRFE